MNAYTSDIIQFDISKKTSNGLSLPEMLPRLKDERKLFWIHCDLNDKAFLASLTTQLDIPDSVLQMISDPNPLAQMEETDDTITVKIQAPLENSRDKDKHPTYSALTIYLTHHYCLTFCRGMVPALTEFRHQYDKSLHFAKTPCFIFFVIFDNILNEYAKLIFNFESHSDDLEPSTHSAHKNHYRVLSQIKKSVIQCKRYISALRDTLMRTSGKKIGVISEPCRKSLIDLYNHSQTLTAEADSEREILNSMLDQIDNGIMQRLSETMKILTAYATMFMPPTLIAGIYGMNFRWMPELEWHYGYFYALALIVGSGLSFFLVFKRLKWF